MSRAVAHYVPAADASTRVEIPEDVAKIAWKRVKPLLVPAYYAENVLMAFGISCYLQGAMDSRQPEVDEQLSLLVARGGSDGGQG